MSKEPTRLVQIRLPVALIEALGVMGRSKDVDRKRADLITASLMAMFWSWSHGNGGPDQIMAKAGAEGYGAWDKKSSPEGRSRGIGGVVSTPR
jgi:hypothetical protein